MTTKDRYIDTYRKFGTLLLITGFTFLIVAVGAIIVSLS